MKKLLVTGANGLLGSACVRVFGEEFNVFAVRHVDLRSRVETRALFEDIRPQYVIHCAAKVGGVKANRDNPVEFIQDNVTINGNVIAAAHEFGVEKLINIGTSCMFPKHAAVPVREDSYMTGPLEPDVEAYAQAKILAYSLCNAYRRQHGCNFVTVCPGNIYGPGDNYGPSAHVVPALIARLAECQRTKSPLSVWGDGTAVREFIYSYDAALAIKAVLENWDSPELINIGTGVSTSIEELVLSLMEASSVGVDVVWDTSQPTGIRKKTFDVSKIKSLGWRPKTSLIDGLRATWKDYIENQNRRNK